MDRIGTPFGCLIFPALPEVAKVHLSIEAQCGTACFPMGDCHMNCFSGPLPLRSHYNSPPLGVCFRESLVLIDYTQKLTRSTLALKLSVAQSVYLWVTATGMIYRVVLRLCACPLSRVPSGVSVYYIMCYEKHVHSTACCQS